MLVREELANTLCALHTLFLHHLSAHVSHDICGAVQGKSRLNMSVQNVLCDDGKLLFFFKNTQYIIQLLAVSPPPPENRVWLVSVTHDLLNRQEPLTRLIHWRAISRE